MISHEKKVIFIHVPRTGGKKIAEYLYPYCDEESLRFSKFVPDGHLHASYWEYIEYYGKEIEQYKVVSMVRNPWDRCLSQFMHLHNNNFHPEIFRSTIVNFEDHGLWAPSQCGFFASQKPPALPAGQPLSWGFFGPATNPYQMAHYKEILSIPHCLRFEKYEQHVSEFFDYFDIKYDRESLKKKLNTSSHDHYSHYYTPELRTHVATWAGFDLQLFNYNFIDDGAPPGQLVKRDVPELPPLWLEDILIGDK